MSDSEDEVEHLQYKVIVMGDGAVGKTSLINRFCQDGFGQSYKQTIGVDFFNKKVTLPGNIHVTLQIWDIGGQQIGGKMLSKYIYGSAAIVFVYDITNPETFKNLEDWYGFVLSTYKAEKKPLMAVAGNKADLQHLRQVKQEKHSLFAIERQMSQYLVSAKTGERVNGMFMRLAADLAGVQLTKGDVDAVEKVVTAGIVDHPSAGEPTGPRGPQKEEPDSGCSVM